MLCFTFTNSHWSSDYEDICMISHSWYDVCGLVANWMWLTEMREIHSFFNKHLISPPRYAGSSAWEWPLLGTHNLCFEDIPAKLSAWQWSRQCEEWEDCQNKSKANSANGALQLLFSLWVKSFPLHGLNNGSITSPIAVPK